MVCPTTGKSPTDWTAIIRPMTPRKPSGLTDSAGHAAVDGQDLAGNVSSPRTGQKGHRIGHFLRLAEPAQRGHGFDLLQGRGRHVFEHSGLDESGRNSIDG